MKRRFDRLCPAVSAAVCAAAVFLCAGTSRGAGLQVLRGHVPAAVAGLKPVGQVDASNRMHLAISLPLRDGEGLATLLRQIYDPTSPKYHHYLTPAQFAQAFGPTAADYQAVAAFAVSNNWVVTGLYPNRSLLDVDASVAEVERALNLTVRVYDHPTEGRTFFAPDREPSLGLRVPVLYISGLDNYMLPHPNYRAVPMSQADTNRPALGSGPGGTYFGSDFRTAYVPGVTLDGSGQKVALFEFDGYYPNDIAQYEGLAGLPSVPLVNVPIDGFVGPPGGNNGEVALDIEMAVCMAPGLSQIVVYEAPNNGLVSVVDDMLGRIANDDAANQVSASWTYGIDAGSDQIFQQMAAQGQSFFNAAGDSGAYPPGQVSPPTDDTNITVVGGTTLFTTGPRGPWQSETVWSWFTAGTGEAAGSGGISVINGIPPWQAGINMTANQGSTTFRNLPDVALTADNIFIVADNGEPEDVGGTSAATPLWAGFLSLVNQQAFTSGKQPMGFINPAIYTIGKGPLYGTCFHDIATGNNTNYVSPALFYAVPGYDLCTGWGTPTGSNLINALSPIIFTPVLAVATNIITGGNGNGMIDFDECNNLTVVLTNEGTVAATSVQGLLTSLTPGVIVAQGSSAYPELLPRQAAANLTAYTVSTEPTFVCGTLVNLMLIVKSDQVIQTNLITLASGVIGSPVTFTSGVSNSISATNFLGIYSPITVSNLDTVAKLTVSVFISALYDAGLGMELISPDGTTVSLSEFNGGLGSDYGVACAAIDETTFDDAAALPITYASPPYIGSYAPQQSLSTYKLLSGTNLNGVWMLHVMNEFQQDTAALQCWSLNVSPYDCTDGGGECPGSALSLTMADSPNTVLVGSNLVYNLTVSNAGPSTAKNVAITQTLPPGVGFVTTSNYPVSTNLTGSNLNLTLGTIAVYGTASVSVVTIPTLPGLITSVATVGSPGNPSASASASSLVTVPGADLAVTMTAAPAFVLQGGPLTYTIIVTNNGPFAAQGVVLNNNLPPNINFISASTTQGVISPGAATVQIGTLPTGTNVIVTLVVSPTVTGNLSASTQVALSPLETDPVSFNNAASVTVTVGPSADLGVTAAAIPSTVLSGSNFVCAATVVNNGPSTANNVVFSQTVPAGATFVSSSRAGVILTNSVITWDIGTMTNGSSLVISNVLRAPTLLSGVQSNLLSSSLSLFGQPGDPVTNNNTVLLQVLVEPPTITIVPAGAKLILPANNNGSVNPGESVEIQFNLQNTGNIPTTNLVATLQATGGVTLPSGAQSYGVMAPVGGGGAPVGRLFSFTANSTNGGTVVATLQLQDGTANLGTNTFNFVMPGLYAFWNTNEIDVPNNHLVPEPDSGPADPYPSTIAVSNVNGLVSTVTVTISNMTHTYPNDVGMMLIGPTGLASTLMVNAAAYSSMSGVTFTFDPTAAVPLPSNGYIVSSSYLPEDYNASFIFTNSFTNPPLSVLFPNSATNPPLPVVGANLAGFAGLSPNGTWSLYVYDAVNGDAGGISNGWGLTITTITPINPVSDLAAGIVASTNRVIIGNDLTYVLSVTNDSTTNAITGTLSNVLSAGLSFVSTSFAPGAYTVENNGQTIVFTLGTLAPGAGLTITNVVMATAPNGPQTNTVYALSGLTAGNGSNYTASAITTNLLPYADLGAYISVLTNTVVASNNTGYTAVVNSNLVYTLIVTNYGPSNATGVSGSFLLSGLGLVSAPDNATSNNGVVNVGFGTLPVGNIATVVLTTAPPSIGTLTNVWTVSTTGANDTNTANNTASSIVTVTNSYPVIAPGTATLTGQGTSKPNGAINAGETVTVAFTVNNIGSGPTTTNLEATLQASGGIAPGAISQQSYGQIPAGGSAAQSFSFSASGAAGSAVTATLSLLDGTNPLPNVSYVFYLPVTTNYSNPSVIVIPDFGPGTPYPSQIRVGSLTGLVSKVTATLNGFAHSYPHDVSALLVSPAGQELLLMSHCGGPYGVSNLVLTFDDAASQTLPTTQMTSGTYLPTLYNAFTQFPGVPTPSTAQEALAVFNGTNPNGYWSLYVYDDTPGNNGDISGGWSLGLTAVNTVNPPARLEAGMIHAPDPAYLGNYLSYQITITNLGPSNATSVVLTDVLPGALAFSSAALSAGSASNSGNTVTCNLGTMVPGAVVTATLRVVAGAIGTVVNTATVSTASTDLFLADSTASNTNNVNTPVFAYLSATNTANGVQLTLRGQPSQNYALQVSTNLPAWTTISSITTGLDGTYIYLETQTNAPARFYRSLQLAQ